MDKVTPPQSPEAEEAVIGGLIILGQLPPAVELLLLPRMFVRPLWRETYAALVALSAEGVPWDVLIIAEAVAPALKREVSEVAGELMGAMAEVPHTWHVEAYARIVRREWQRRDLLAIAGSAAKLAHDETDVPAVVALLRARLDQVDDEAALAESGELAPVAARVRDEQAAGVVPGWPTNVRHYDRWSRGGLRPRQLHLIGGQTGVGKTMLVTQIITAAAAAGASVCLFSLEMPADEMFVRLCAGYMGAAALKLHNREPFTATEEAAYLEAEARVLGSPIKVFDSAYRLDAIRAITRMERPDVIVVDFIQNMDPPPGNWQREDQELDANMRGLHRLAKVEGCCAVAVSQLNNEGVRDGRNGTPSVTAFRGSGGIGNAASLAVMLTKTNTPGKVTLWNLKNRFGPDGGSGDYALATATGLLVPIEAVGSPFAYGMPSGDQ